MPNFGVFLCCISRCQKMSPHLNRLDHPLLLPTLHYHYLHHDHHLLSEGTTKPLPALVDLVLLGRRLIPPKLILSSGLPPAVNLVLPKPYPATDLVLSKPCQATLTLPFLTWSNTGEFAILFALEKNSSWL